MDLDELSALLTRRSFEVARIGGGRYSAQLLIDKTPVFDDPLVFDSHANRYRRGESFQSVLRSLGLFPTEAEYLASPDFSDFALKICVALAQVAECLPRKRTKDTAVWPRTLSTAKYGQLQTVTDRWVRWIGSEDRNWTPIEATAIEKFDNIRASARERDLPQFQALLDRLWP